MKKLLCFLNCVLVLAFSVSCGRQNADVFLERRDISTELIYEYSEETEFAEGFSIDYYQKGYALVFISDGSRFLLVPENEAVPSDLKADIKVLEQPVSNIYLAASAVMDMFCAVDAADCIRFSGTKEEGWYIDEAKQAMQNGRILYAGKYSAPDYELILSKGCKLSIQSTMISHSPEVKEKLEGFQIPVLVDYSSYEEHPLGRCEWVKLYGALTGKKEEAKEAFAKQRDAFLKVKAEVYKAGNPKGKTVAFFYINSNGTASVRKSGDYVAKMIELAGGTYVFSDLGKNGNSSSSVNMQMEEFYSSAKEADYLIYNSTIDGGVDSLEELFAKSPLLTDFKAVKNGKVFCTAQNMYQASMKTGTLIADIHRMLGAEDTADEQFQFLYKLE